MHSEFPGATSPSLGLLMTSFPHNSQWPLHHDQERLMGVVHMLLTAFTTGAPNPPWLFSSAGLNSSCPRLGARVKMRIWKWIGLFSAVF